MGRSDSSWNAVIIHTEMHVYKMLLGHPGSTSLLLIQLAPAVLSLLEVSLEIICCCGSEACCSILLSFFCRCKMMISESGLGP